MTTYQQTPEKGVKPARGDAEVATAARADETPRGTLFILFGYAAVLVALWGYTYLSLILRR